MFLPPQPPPPYGVPGPQLPQAARAEGRALISLLASLLGLLLVATVLILAGIGWQSGIGSFLNALWLGIPALALGPIGYFLGRSNLRSGAATSGTVMGVAATALGAGATLILLVLVLVDFFGPPPG